MDWSNERYVRIYVRDTRDLIAIGWQGRAVLWEMIRKADRSGIVDADIDTLPDIIRMPQDVVRDAMDSIVERGIVKITDSGYLINNFIEAQECAQSDKQRQRESRANRRAKAKEQELQGKDDCVTRCHTLSRSVTPSLAVPSLTNNICAPDAAPYTSDFESFWKSYPAVRRKGKKAAYKAWKGAIKDKTWPGLDGILKALSLQCNSVQWRSDGGKYVPMPTTWLNQARWDDEVQNCTNAGYRQSPDLMPQVDTEAVRRSREEHERAKAELIAKANRNSKGEQPTSIAAEMLSALGLKEEP